MLENLKSLQITYGQELSLLERDWLAGNLKALRGVSDTVCCPDGSPVLCIEFDADRITAMELLDYLCFCGISPELPPPVPDKWGTPDVSKPTA